MQQILLLPQAGRAAKAFAGVAYGARHGVYALRAVPVRLLAAAQAERERWVLWLPVLIGIGVWGYFALPLEPGLGWLGLSPACALLAFCLRQTGWRLPLIVALLSVLGFNAAQLATWRTMTPLLQRQSYIPDLTGRVVTVEPAPNGVTLQLDELTSVTPLREGLPPQVRLKLRQPIADAPEVGSMVALGATLMPLSEPVSPDAYDFRRQGFFNGIGAQGFARGAVRVVAPPPETAGLLLWIEGLRGTIAKRVAERLQGDTAQIATALLNGAQSGISPATLQAMRASGLFHILSISGLHLAIVAAFLFVGLRRLLALSATLALHTPIKKIAAALALLILPFYTLLVGEPVPAVRSALMTSLVLLAVLVDRQALSLRSVALAATALLLVVPQAMLGASFQLSFAAVTVMIAGYETIRRLRQPGLGRKAERPRWLQLVAALWGHGGGIALTSLLAGVATAPLTLFQFQQANWYGIVANMLGIPLTSFIIMPAGFLAYFLMPFGLEAPALALMGWGIDRLIDLAAFVGAWPGATLAVSVFPTYAFAMMLAGGLWLCVWQRRWRLLGIVPVMLGIMLALLAPRPDIMIAPEFANCAVRLDDDSWLTRQGGEKNFVIKQWQQQAGAAEFVNLAEAPETEQMRCDALGCLYQAKGQNVLFAQDAAALSEDCGMADLIITPMWQQPCAQGKTVDGARLKWRGATSVTLRSDGAPVIHSVRARWGARPWSPGWKRGEGLIRQTVRSPTVEGVTREIKAEQEGEGE